jgi:hypothetical protein
MRKSWLSQIHVLEARRAQVVSEWAAGVSVRLAIHCRARLLSLDSRLSVARAGYQLERVRSRSYWRRWRDAKGGL